ncbi:MAG: shikimate kinase [Cyclobacteriaceae bacterium]
MKSFKKIFLVGLPGSGKSTFGKKLAAQIELDFIDLDTEIVKHEAMSIPEIFKHRGEDAFRTIERDNLEEVIKNKDCFVLATGGGAPCFFNNIETMISAGVVIFLNEDIEEIVTRVSIEKATRPLIEKIGDDDMFKNLTALYKKRFPFYNKADLTLSPEEISIDKALEKLSQLSGAKT